MYFFEVGCMMKKRKHSAHSLGLWLMMLIWSAFMVQGCSLVLPTGETKTRKERGVGPCESNADCLEGQICLQNVRYCRTMGNDVSQKLSLQLLAPSKYQFKKDGSTGLITKQQYLNVDVADLQNGTIRPREAFEVKGIVWAWEKGISGDERIKIAAKIRFIDQNHIEGQSLIWEVKSQSSTGQYTTQLSLGTYTVDIFPENEEYPTFRVKDFKVEQTREADFELPSRASCFVLKGRLVAADSTPYRSIEGVEVQVLNKDGWPMSTVSTTDKNGDFKLWLTKNEKATTFRVRMKNAELSLHPQIDIPYTLIADSVQPQGKVIDLGTLPIGYNKQAITVKGTVRTGQGGALSAGSSVRLFGKFDIGVINNEPFQGEFVTQTRTDKLGQFELKVPPGNNYQIEVLPPAKSEWAKSLIELKQLKESKEMDIDLIKKYRVEGKVCREGPHGNCEAMIKDAQVRAVWQGSPGSSRHEEYIPLSSSSQQTKNVNEDGSFALALDPGVYNLIFIPPSGSGLARTYLQTCVGDNRTELQAFLPEAKYLGGRVMGPDGFPIEGMTIELYEHTVRYTNITSANTPQSARLLGRGVTNSQGNFSIPYAIPKVVSTTLCQ
ncbi:MAG TPA: hypothetical protein DCE42_15505 [Myxococcales bacterium]|nr:hypothetical protein [Deltaproteobacteria bacterium]MBU53695.1 hypothetical protein [Deltaproteobacteria bacterium]HAA56170.1 hypothetical protein [Myxococcales bacterium]|tara:strand:+ start:16986 stop:18806 length:1821 start_codon:yes stop_codon:yes gene_type:complete